MDEKNDRYKIFSVLILSAEVIIRLYLKTRPYVLLLKAEHCYESCPSAQAMLNVRSASFLERIKLQSD